MRDFDKQLDKFFDRHYTFVILHRWRYQTLGYAVILPSPCRTYVHNTGYRAQTNLYRFNLTVNFHFYQFMLNQQHTYICRHRNMYICILGMYVCA